MRFVELQSKDVVNVTNGCKVGFISDVEIDWCTRCIQAIIVEKCNFFKLLCFFKEAPSIVIPVECIVSIGGDVILVSLEG
ncbi:YlmC/YmxH family sporulation protein [uncultured Thomasclavelia sp.]|uniref:YlmC/YmxH family sporulation protein n=1 Tax=uncultured Thomasclavelia sp. TaxID=3025759 RepID=UPI0025FB3654|nr:YlmC/YmxH family sporulation protein [uncultured Thomasclavelia sp.]